jgi:hypothetical protein
MRTAIAIAHVLPIASLLALATREPPGADLRRLGLSLYLAKLFGSNDMEATAPLVAGACWPVLLSFPENYLRHFRAHQLSRY